MVYWSVTIISPAKMAKLTEMLFGVWTLVGTENHVLDGGPDPSQDGAISRGKRCSLFHERCKNGCIDQDAVWEMDSGEPKEACSRWGHIVATWQIQMNHLCAALCQLSWQTQVSNRVFIKHNIFTKQTLVTSFVKCWATIHVGISYADKIAVTLFFWLLCSTTTTFIILSWPHRCTVSSHLMHTLKTICNSFSQNWWKSSFKLLTAI